MIRPITSDDDFIDTRDVLEYIAEVDEGEEKESLHALIDEIRERGYGDTPEDGVSLIRDSYFETYAQELAEDIGAISKDYQWPLSCIDWDRAARELQMDYMPIEFEGVTYWCR